MPDKEDNATADPNSDPDPRQEDDPSGVLPKWLHRLICRQWPTRFLWTFTLTSLIVSLGVVIAIGGFVAYLIPENQLLEWFTEHHQEPEELMDDENSATWWEICLNVLKSAEFLTAAPGIIGTIVFSVSILLRHRDSIRTAWNRGYGFVSGKDSKRIPGPFELLPLGYVACFIALTWTMCDHGRKRARMVIHEDVLIQANQIEDQIEDESERRKDLHAMLIYTIAQARALANQTDGTSPDGPRKRVAKAFGSHAKYDLLRESHEQLLAAQTKASHHEEALVELGHPGLQTPLTVVTDDYLRILNLYADFTAEVSLQRDAKKNTEDEASVEPAEQDGETTEQDRKTDEQTDKKDDVPSFDELAKQILQELKTLSANASQLQLSLEATGYQLAIMQNGSDTSLAFELEELNRKVSELPEEIKQLKTQVGENAEELETVGESAKTLTKSTKELQGSVNSMEGTLASLLELNGLEEDVFVYPILHDLGQDAVKQEQIDDLKELVRALKAGWPLKEGEQAVSIRIDVVGASSAEPWLGMSAGENRDTNKSLADRRAKTVFDRLAGREGLDMNARDAKVETPLAKPKFDGTTVIATVEEGNIQLNLCHWQDFDEMAKDRLASIKKANASLVQGALGAYNRRTEIRISRQLEND